MRVCLKNKESKDDTGTWFVMPTNVAAVEYILGKGSYVVIDTELPFFLEKGVYDLEKLNYACAAVESFENSFPREDVIEIQKKWFSSIFDLLNHVEELKYWPNCSSMLQVVERMMENSGNELGDLPEDLKKYVDIDLYAEKLETERDFLVTETGVYERRK